MPKAKKVTPRSKPAPSRAREVIVTIDDRHMNELGKVTRGLEKAGLQVHEVLGLTGQVVGNWLGHSLQPLQKVTGVISAEESRETVLPPPESDIQ